jgi:hypothetical protein
VIALALLSAMQTMPVTEADIKANEGSVAKETAAAMAKATPHQTPAQITAARITVEKYSACFYSQASSQIRALLDEPVGGPSDSFKWSRLSNSDCMPTTAVGMQVRFQPNVIRGSIYEVMFFRDFAKAPPVSSFEGVAPIAYPRMVPPSSSSAQAYVVETDIGDCVVRAAPAASHTLITTKLGTDAERSAINALVPVIGPCTPAGAQLKFSLSIIRGMIAESLYRLTQAKFGAKDK